MSSSLTERAIPCSERKSYHVYFLLNEVGQPYVGSTGHDPQKRLQEHNDGLNRWTKARRPWRVVYVETFATKTEALRRERYFKSGTGRRERDEIIRRLEGS